MARRLSYPEYPEEDLASTTQSDMQDFSISSLISNVSKLLEGNNSSFLVHVDSKRQSRSPMVLNTDNSELSPSETRQPLREDDDHTSDILVPSTPVDRTHGNLDKNCHDPAKNVREDIPTEIFSVADLVAKAGNGMRIAKSSKALSQNSDIPVVGSSLSMESKLYPDLEATNQDSNLKPEEEHSSDNFLLSDIFKGIKCPLPIRRFPAPMLPAIFEQSCEDMSMSRSRTSSAASSVARSSASNHNTQKASKPTLVPSSSDDSLRSSTNKRKRDSQSVLIKQDSKIPVPIPIKSRENKTADISSKQLELSNMPNSKDSSSIWSPLGQQTVLMVGTADHDKKLENPFTSLSGEWINGPSFDNPEPEYQRSDEADSWDEFDKIMDKSMPPKSLELHEFEELATEQKSVRVEKENANSFEYVSSEDARLLMDKDEEDRVQFLKSQDVSFANGGDSMVGDPGVDIFSMTNYFQRRSSFPIDNRANESSMFQDDFTARQEDVQLSVLSANHTIEKDIVETSITPNSNTVLEVTESPSPQPSQIQTPGTPSVLVALDPKTKNLARFLMGSESNGIEKNSIMEHVLEMCKRRSSYGLSNSITPSPDGPLPAEEPEPELQISISESSSKKDQINTQKSTSEQDQVTAGDQHIRGPEFLKPKEHIHHKKSTKGTTVGTKPLARSNSSPSTSARNRVRFQKPLEAILTQKHVNKEDEVETSIMLSEHGKAAFFDDVDTHGMNGFDEFKRYLMGARSAKTNNRKSNNLKENRRPEPSAFVPLAIPSTNSNAGPKPEAEDSLRTSVERLRRITPSPPEKLVTRKVPNNLFNEEHLQAMQTVIASRLTEQNPPHSTPITIEPLSVQLAKSMCSDKSNPKVEEVAKVDAIGTSNTKSNSSRHSTQTDIASGTSHRGGTASSTPNDFDQKLKEILLDPKGRFQPGPPDSLKNPTSDSFRSVEVARGHPSRQTSRPHSRNSQDDYHPKAKGPSSEKGNEVVSSIVQPDSISLASALGSNTAHSGPPCGHHAPTLPPPYGFPLSIHIHLPTLPYLQPQYPHQSAQYSQYSGYPSGSHLQAPSSNPCQCQCPPQGSHSHQK